MKLKYIFCIAGLAVLMAAAGCAKQTEEETPVPEVPDEIQTEELSPEAPDEIHSEAPSAEAASDIPLRIWGNITGIEDSGIWVDNQSENSSAGDIILNIDPELNTVLDAVTGLPLTLDEVQTGSFEAYLGPAMTMSLPPMTNPILVIANIPEDFQAPQYAVAAKDLTEENGVFVLTATDGRTYQIPEDAEVTPFLTRNIVTLDDIKEGSRCLIWMNEENIAEKVVLFAD